MFVNGLGIAEEAEVISSFLKASEQGLVLNIAIERARERVA